MEKEVFIPKLSGTIRNIIRDSGKVELVVACGVDLKVSVTAQAVENLGLRAGKLRFIC